VTQYIRASLRFVVYGVRLRRVHLIEVTVLKLEVEGSFVIADELKTGFAKGAVE
jgi:hypothetical protein